MKVIWGLQSSNVNKFILANNKYILAKQVSIQAFTEEGKWSQKMSMYLISLHWVHKLRIFNISLPSNRAALTLNIWIPQSINFRVKHVWQMAVFPTDWPHIYFQVHDRWRTQPIYEKSEPNTRPSCFSRCHSERSPWRDCGCRQVTVLFLVKSCLSFLDIFHPSYLLIYHCSVHKEQQEKALQSASKTARFVTTEYSKYHNGQGKSKFLTKKGELEEEFIIEYVRENIEELRPCLQSWLMIFMGCLSVDDHRDTQSLGSREPDEVGQNICLGLVGTRALFSACFAHEQWEAISGVYIPLFTQCEKR